jgi:hypothetical protein
MPASSSWISAMLRVESITRKRCGASAARRWYSLRVAWKKSSFSRSNLSRSRV